MPTATFAILEEVSAQPRPEQAFVAHPAEGCTEALDAFGHCMTVKISSRDTGGAFVVIEDITPPRPTTGVHRNFFPKRQVIMAPYRTSSPIGYHTNTTDGSIAKIGWDLRRGELG